MSLDNNAGQMDEIVIHDVFEDNEDEIREINLEFVQDSSFKGIHRAFTIFNNSQLNQTLRSFKNKRGRKHRINLRYLALEPVRNRRFAWNYLYAAGIAVLLTGIPAIIWYFTDLNPAYLLVAALLLTVAGLISLMLFFYHSRDTFIYKSLAAGVPLVELDNRKPNLREFDAFLYKLEEYIRKAQASGMSRQQMLAGELKDLRRLKDQGLLSEEVYERARAVIFKHKDYSASQ